MHGSAIIFHYPALLAIRAYQLYLSPLKGYACAFRVLTGRDNCSAYGYRVIARFGLLRGLALLRRRTRACSQHLQAHRAAAPATRCHTARHQAQAGYCDCDLPSADCAACSCDGSDLIDCCDWPREKKKKQH
ncbi:membrane protein insertion efficiency factor YidD [Janthinobacterium sp. RB2R34]|uniref:membrane protein insertion efficiency factor YidD n=1 Tax=Janthinobacterium sp. RB2R34 TaxID=3424193 RepID=UPI003F237B22